MQGERMYTIKSTCIILRNVILRVYNYVLQRGARLFGAQQHSRVILVFKIGGGQDGLYPGLLQTIGYLVELVGGVYRDGDEARPRRRDETDYPLNVVGRPYAEPIAPFQAEPLQAGRETVGPAEYLVEREPHALVERDRALLVAPSPRSVRRQFAQRFVGNGHVARLEQMRPTCLHVPRLCATRSVTSSIARPPISSKR